jgi:hypothetical protein
MSTFSENFQAMRRAPYNWALFWPETEADIRVQHYNGIMPGEYFDPIDYDKAKPQRPDFIDSYFYCCCNLDGLLFIPGSEEMEIEYNKQFPPP